VGVAVKGNSGVGFERAGDVEELSANGLDAGCVSSRRPLHIAENRRVLSFVDSGKKPFQRGQWRRLEQPMQGNAVLE